MNKRLKTLYVILMSIAISAIAVFGFIWFQPSTIPNNFTGWWRIVDVILYALLTYVLWHSIVMRVFTWLVAYNTKDIRHQAPEDGLKVAFVTTFVPGSESISLLHRTLPAMVKAYYAHDTWLLDEGNDPEVAKLCKRFGVKHFSRKDKNHYNTDDGKFAKKTKGGNHNSWYDTHGQKYDFVAQIDTDFIPKKTFLVKTLGYFRDPEIAFVGTPQIYGNTHESFVARAAAEQTYSFYGPLLKGFNGMQMNMLIGANHVIRVKALESVDHYSAHITEDLLTGMKLHSGRWKSAYVDQVLAVGEGPSTWDSYFKQQMRWAYGCMDVLFKHSFQLMRSMGVRQAFYYFLLQQHYFTGVVMVVSVMLLATYFIFGVVAAEVDILLFISIYLTVLVSSGLFNIWLQRLNIRPKRESGLLIPGRVASIAAWPVFFLAFYGVVFRKNLTYKVTPKGHKSRPYDAPLRLFIPHIIIGVICAGLALSAIFTGYSSPIMLFWAICTSILLLSVPFALPISYTLVGIFSWVKSTLIKINKHYYLFEFRSHDKGLLPDSPNRSEKYSYVKSNHRILVILSVLSFALISISMFNFISSNTFLWILFPYFVLSLIYFVVSLIVNASSNKFDLSRHRRLVKRWRSKHKPTVDVFLPTAGESLRILENTWTGVKDAMATYNGSVVVYVLDDSGSDEVRALSESFGFKYESRPNKGEFKKAGNLRHGFKVSKGEFIAIFDADFRPRKDFFDELLPYFSVDKKLGIMQSPQYFDINRNQNWLERGAGAVQEMFYRFCQVTRHNYDAAICVGSNAIYRRAALDEIGGTALIEHSEDVHTGFDLSKKGWKVGYIPVVLAKGLCPSDMESFFKQQYRWCLGSMTLLSSSKFWNLKLNLRARLSYMSGFLHYIFTALTAVVFPAIPLVLIFIIPEQILWQNYFLIIPSIIYAQIIYPLWHKSSYGIEAWSVRMIYSWAHLFAVFDTLTRNHMQWQPTGTVATSINIKYAVFRTLQIVFNLFPSIAWVIGAGILMVDDPLLYLPIFASGVYFMFVSAKIAIYAKRGTLQINSVGGIPQTS